MTAIRPEQAVSNIGPNFEGGLPDVTEESDGITAAPIEHMPAPIVPKGDRLLSPGEVAKQLGWQTIWVNSLINWGLLPVVKTVGSFPQIQASKMNRILEAAEHKLRVK